MESAMPTKRDDETQDAFLIRLVTSLGHEWPSFL